ncbi:MAG: hypothetical protein Q7S40_31440 [Opitutaceae bacterium]|nr:hypothetical protein [Opitutaceae bacterium]
MGFFDRFTAKKPAPRAVSEPTPARTEPANDAAAAPAVPAAAPAVGSVKSRLAAASERLDAADLPGAVAIYEEVLAMAGDRADVLVAISGDLGSHGHVAQIVELVAPRYDADRHGPATGLNLLQAYLAMREPDAAQHVLDILFALRRPELEDRLHGFSNAIAEMIATPDKGPAVPVPGGGPGEPPKVGLITVSKPIWFYGLEPLAAQILPPKESRLRRIAFAQLAVPGHTDNADAKKQPEDELGRLSRAIPLWLAETFYFSPIYSAVAAIGVMTPPEGSSHFVPFLTEWTTDNLRQLVETSADGLDYIFTGALKVTAGDYELVLRAWDVKSYRERKAFTARWTPATADAALVQLHAQVRGYMEWSPSSAAFAYTIPAQPRAWLETLGASLGLFLAEKSIAPRELLRPVADDLAAAARLAATGEAASFAFLTMRARAQRLGLGDAPPDATLARSPLVNQAAKLP